MFFLPWCHFVVLYRSGPRGPCGLGSTWCTRCIVFLFWCHFTVQVRFSGVMWFGFETPDAVVGGLDKRTYSDHLDQMQSLGFNMIRLPFAGDTLLESTYPAEGTIDANPDLKVQYRTSHNTYDLQTMLFVLHPSLALCAGPYLATCHCLCTCTCHCTQGLTSLQGIQGHLRGRLLRHEGHYVCP